MKRNYCYCSLLDLYDEDDGDDEGEHELDGDKDVDVQKHSTDLHLLLNLDWLLNDSLFHMEISLLIRIVVEMLNDNSWSDRDNDDGPMDAMIVHRVTMLVVQFYRLILMTMKQEMESEPVKDLLWSLTEMEEVSMMGHLSN